MKAVPAGINGQVVTDWLFTEVDGLSGPLIFELIAGGHSNLTYSVTDTVGRCLVLRRPPLGHVLESAHDMAREHKIISALANSRVPVAPALGLCTDAAVNDAPFYIMEFVRGTVLHDAEAAAAVSNAERHQLGMHVITVLADLHTTDPDGVGLGDLGRKEAYLERQLKRWTKQWEATKTHEIPEMEECIRLLNEQKPDQIGASIVHGDYRLGNMMVDGGKIQGVLDWELCTLGDPLADVGYLLNSWLTAEEDVEQVTPTGTGGFPSRDELCGYYEQATGRELSGINYYRAFSHWRLAAIGQGVYKRYLVGAMGDNDSLDLETYKESVTTRAQAALELLKP